METFVEQADTIVKKLTSENGTLTEELKSTSEQRDELLEIRTELEILVQKRNERVKELEQTNLRLRNEIDELQSTLKQTQNSLE